MSGRVVPLRVVAWVRACPYVGGRTDPAGRPVTWPAVLARLAASHITNYSIHLRRPENLLIAYYEYTGDDLAADKAAIAADPETQRWWAITDPMQRPLDSMPPTDGSQAGGWWASTEEVFHLA